MCAEIFGVPAARQTSIQQPVAGYAMRRAGIQSAPSPVDVKCDGNATHETCGRDLVDAYSSRVASWPDAAPLTRATTRRSPRATS